MKELGIVERLENDTAFLRFERTSACAKCGACGMLAGQNNIVVEMKNTLGAVVGDRVEVAFTAKNALGSSAIAYLFPLGMLFLGVFLGNVIPQSVFEEKDVFAAILGIVFAAGGFFILKLLNPYFKKKFSNVYTMIHIEGK